MYETVLAARAIFTRTDISLTLLVLIWGINFSVLKAALAELHPLVFNGLRMCAGAGLLLLATTRWHSGPRIERSDWLALLGIGLLGNTAYQLLFIFGLDATLAGNSSLILAAGPVFITLLSAKLGHERVSPLAWSGLVVSVAGVALVIYGGTRVAFGRDTILGDLLTLGAAVAWALYTVMAAPYVRRYGALPVTTVTVAVGAAGLLLASLPFLAKESWAAVTWTGWGGLAYSAVLAIALSYFLWYHNVERIGNTRTAVYSNAIPVVAVLVAWLWLGEQPTWLQAAGAAGIFAGIALTRVGGVHRGSPARWGR